MVCMNQIGFHRTILELTLLISSLDYVRSSLSDVTSSVFGSQNPSGTVVAFGDLDANKATDIFVLSSDGKYIKLY